MSKIIKEVAQLHLPDHQLSELEYSERYIARLGGSIEAEEYLRLRYRWLKGQINYIPVIEAFNNYEKVHARK